MQDEVTGNDYETFSGKQYRLPSYTALNNSGDSGITGVRHHKVLWCFKWSPHQAIEFGFYDGREGVLVVYVL